MLQGRVAAPAVGENPRQGIETGNKWEEAEVLAGKPKAALVGAALGPSRNTTCVETRCDDSHPNENRTLRVALG
jgi:hypothetical protein